jgi:PPOX class probable F420-dependent enzyme
VTPGPERRSWSGTALLTTFRRSGEPVATPVSILVRADHAYFATPAASGKTKRLAVDDRVTIAPCTVRGEVRSPARAGRARTLAPGRQRRLLSPTRSLFWSYLGYRLRGQDMRWYEIALEPTPPEQRPDGRTPADAGVRPFGRDRTRGQPGTPPRSRASRRCPRRSCPRSGCGG